MDLLVYLYSFILGTIIGSFLNVIIDRLPKDESWIKTRSHCDHCRYKLSWMDLIPLFSFISLRGRCRYCGVRLSLFYPFIETLTGLIFAIIALFVFGATPLLYVSDIRFILAALYFWAIASSLIIIFFIDLKSGIIPFSVVIFATILSLIWYLAFPFFHFSSNELPFIALRIDFFTNYLFSGLGSFLFFFILFAVTRGRGLGFGDVIFAFLMGFLLGFPKIILAFYIAFISGALISVLLIVAGRKKLKKSSIPFGPFLTLGTFISLFWGQSLISNILLWLLPH